ncbi:hypothetical protein BCV08_18775, partial [Vibrio breoganii]|uniref:class I SAM-dependent methyltransferase n=1 Tax=Vibrio breoganii TaxID=553239 RepID=UPI000C85BA5C
TIISILKERLKPDMNLFEFGSGYSTIFFAKYVNSVTSIEYDRSWFDLVKSQIPSNANLVYKKNDIDGDYCRSIDKMSKSFDVVVIDGRDRVNCVKNSIQYLTPDGIMLLDDSHRSKYDEAILYATKRGFRALHIEGLKPSGSRIDRTTILYRDNNCFNI